MPVRFRYLLRFKNSVDKFRYSLSSYYVKTEKAVFITLLIVTFLIAFAVSLIVTVIFNKPIRGILNRIVDDAISSAWVKYLQFAIFVTGISSGVKVWKLERFITPESNPDTTEGAGQAVSQIIELTTERWVLEVYRTVIGTLQGIAWMLLVFFVFALIAYVIVKLFERKKVDQPPESVMK